MRSMMSSGSTSSTRTGALQVDPASEERITKMPRWIDGCRSTPVNAIQIFEGLPGSAAVHIASGVMEEDPLRAQMGLGKETPPSVDLSKPMPAPAAQSGFDAFPARYTAPSAPTAIFWK